MAQDTSNIPDIQPPFNQLREVDADGKEWWKSRICTYCQLPSLLNR